MSNSDKELILESDQMVNLLEAKLCSANHKIKTLEAKVKELEKERNLFKRNLKLANETNKPLAEKIKQLESACLRMAEGIGNNKLVNYGELDLKLSDYLETDDVILISTKDKSEIVDLILKMVDSCSYLSEIQKETAGVVEKLRGKK